MTFLRAIRCPAVSPRRNFSAKIGALANKDAQCTVRISLARRRFSEGGCSIAITAGVRKYAGEQNLSQGEALQAGMEQKAKEFVEKGVEIYAKA
jgi:hypothetical protein